MTANAYETFQTRVVPMLIQNTEYVVQTLKNTFSTVLTPNDVDSSARLPNSTELHESRKGSLPESTVGQTLKDDEFIVLIKKYLEMAGLAFFVCVSWILLVVFIYLFRQRQRNEFKFRHHMLTEINNHEEQYIKARLDELPSWVFFPDIERAEWVNRILKQAWPYANKYLDKEIFRKVLVPLICGTATVLSDFSFEKLDLGETPPRIGSIKVYPDNVRDQVMMDVNVFYAGDAQIKAKVKGIVVGIKDIELSGEMRFILSPLINTIPIFGAITYFFLKKPSINFKLTNAGTLVDIPGLNDILLSQINNIIASMMVLPNRQVLPLANGIQTASLRYSNPQGVVRVFVLRACKLVKADITLFGKGKSDPFVRVKTQGNKEYKTKTIDNTTDPEWNEICEFVVEQFESDSIEFEVFDEDPGKDDFIGRTQFPINSLVEKDAVDTWLTLKDVKTGALNVSLQYFALSKQKSALELMQKATNPLMGHKKLSTALLVCFIEKCTNLPRSKKTRREPNPFCRIKVENAEDRTAALDSQLNPKFEHVSQLFCSNPLEEKLEINICDAKNNQETIAYFELPIRLIYETETMTIESQTFQLKGVSEQLDNASIVLHLSLFMMTAGRSNESRLPSPPASPTMNARSTFNSISASPQVESKKISSTRSLLEDEHVKQPQTNPSPLGIQALAANRFPSDKKGAIASEVSNLTSTKFGIIKLGIRFAATRRALSVTIYCCKNLINVHRQNLPDPYVRLHLMPDFAKDKRKTKSIHDTINPTFDDLFEWQATLADIRRQRLRLSIKNNSPLFAQEQTYMGDLQIDLSNLDPEKSSVAWYVLQEPNTSGGAIMKIKYDTIETVDNTAN